VAPRFMCVIFSFFERLEPSFVLEKLNAWERILMNIEDACVDDDKLKRKVVKAVDKLVRRYASDAFRFIDSIQTLMKLRRRYNFFSDISCLMVRFFKDVDSCIENTVQKNLAEMRCQWSIQAVIKVDADSDERSSDASSASGDDA